MGLDWDRVAGEGGAHLVERAAEVQKTGRLTPIALQLVQDEAERLSYILAEEIPRLEPAGDLTPAAIEALRAVYQSRLDKAKAVITAAHGLPAPPPPLQQPAAPSAAPVQQPTPPAPVPAVAPATAAPSLPTRSLREFFADRSILIISYAGAFLLIVATLLFELSAFTAVDSTARFAGVLLLNLIFATAGWLCYRIPAMRLVGRTYIAIAALMVPLTFIAAWVFLTIEQYGLSRDLAIAIAATTCALLYGALGVRLESKGYALLSLIAMAVGWGAAVDLLRNDRWRGAWLMPLAAVYLILAVGTTRFKNFQTVFAGLADKAVHLAVIGVLLWAIADIASINSVDWPVMALVAGELTLLYIAYVVLQKKGVISPALSGAAAMAFFGITWVAALNIVDLEPLTGLLLTPLIAVYILATYRSRRIAAVDVGFATYGELFVHAAALLALGWTAHSAIDVAPASPTEAWLLGAASLAVTALLYAWYATWSAERYGGLAAMVLLGAAWLCLLNGVEIWPWRGLAFTPIMAFYIAVASRRPVIRNLFASEPELLITGAAAIAAGWSILATGTAADLNAGAAWYPLTATLVVVALLYAADAYLRRDVWSPALSMGVLVGAWIAAGNALQLGAWIGLAMTPLALVFAVVASRGDRLGSLGAAFARRADPFVHAVALIAIAWSAVPAASELADGQAVSQQSFWYLASTFGALTAIYAIYSWLSRRQSMQWTVAIGVTLTTITANQALALNSSALAVEFLVLAIGKAIVARFYRGRMHTFFYATAAVQAIIAGAIPVEQEWLHAVILIAAAGMAVFMAIDASTPDWLYLAGAFFSYGWYWLLKVVIPPPPNPGPSTLVLIFSPLPVIYAAAAVALHRSTALRWRTPLYAWAAVVALGVFVLGINQGELTILGLALLAYAVAIYVATCLEQYPYGVPTASLTAALGALSLLQAGGAQPHWYPLVFVLLSWGLYLPAFLFSHGEWRRMHRYSGISLMAITTVACFLFPDFASAGNAGAFSSLAATWALALMLAIDARAQATPAFDYLALIVASLGSYWIAHYIGASNPQWYLAPPGLALLVAGVMLLSDRRFKTPTQQTANLLIGVGATALLGTTAVQTFDPNLSFSLYTGVLLCESIAGVLVGIALRSRGLVLAGSAGIALASLRALLILIQEVPLFIVFGLVAILLLAGAAALAVLRARFADARVAMTRTWRDWS